MLNRLLALLERSLVVGTYCALLLMMVLISADATVRYLFSDTLPDVYHFTELYLMPMVVFFALSNTQRLKGHVSVALMDNILPRWLRRSILSLTYLAAGVCFILITWRSFNPAWSDIVNWTVTAGVVQWPTGLSRIIVPIGSVVLTLRLVLDSVRVLQGAHDPDAARGGAA